MGQSRIFHEDEPGYESWREETDFGYVFNFFGGTSADFNLIHLLSCSDLNRPTDEGRRTNVPKVCSSDLSELEEFAEENVEAWRHCRKCMK